jgi:hypothetical protein
MQVAYFGPTNKVVAYFADRGLHCTLHYNPADYISKYNIMYNVMYVCMHKVVTNECILSVCKTW